MTSGNGSLCRWSLRVWALALCCAVMLGHLAAAPSTACAEEETPAQRDARMKWWREARFGMFIHWGLYAVPAGTYKNRKIDGIGEWIMHNGPIPVAEYQAYAKQFNPVKFDAEEWVRLAKEAGQKYIVITSKHHDGFAMYHSKAHPFNIYDATPFKRDPLKELAEACKKHGVKLGFYYSQAQDWTAPGGASHRKHWDKAQDGSMDQYIEEKAVPQVKEILTNYGDVAVLWWDTPIGMSKPRADKLLPLLKSQPNIIWNNRLGGGYLGDSETPEQTIPASGFKNRDWETCMTMNKTWGYKSYDQEWKPTELLLRNLIDISSKGGNYLLNVGPTSEGLIPGPSVERLKEMGAWLKINGEAIYATTANPFKKAPPWGRVTKKPGKLYLHVFEWPADQKLSLPTLGAKPEKAWMLVDSEHKPLEITTSEESVTITVPKQAPDKIASVVVLEYSGELKPVDLRIRSAKDGSLTLGAEDAEIHGHMTQLEGKKDGPKNIGHWRNADNWISWSGQIDKPGKYKVEMVYSCPPSSKGTTFDVEVGSQKLAGVVEATEGWDDYKPHAIGEVAIDKPGPREIVLRPKKKAGDAIMNLRSVVLKPAHSAEPAADKSGFVPLFDGKSLAGWQGALKGYEVKDGVLASKAGIGGNLYTKDEYGDFVFRFEFKLTPNANSGIGLRTITKGDSAYVGMESQVLDDSGSDYQKLHPYQYHGSIYGVVAAKRGHLKPVGEWNSEEITCQGRHVKVVLNGATIVDADLDQAAPGGKTIDGKPHPGLARSKGVIGLLGHTHTLEFRNLAIKPL